MIKKEEIFVNESHWRNMGVIETELFALKIFDYYRQEGFPYYPTEMVSRQKGFDSLMKYDRSTLIEDDVVKQTMHGLGLAWSYFPNSFDVQCGNKMTPYQAFMNDEIFMKVIRKRLKMGTYISDSGIRKMLKIFTGVQGVSNFRPTAAAAIYDLFAPNGVVWDMSGGWGGRMLGAIASGVKKYIATEPSTQAYNGLIKIAKDFAGDMEYEIECCGSEEFLLDRETVDLCFTSPPYFDLEKYSGEDTQSYVKYPSKDAWMNYYLKETFLNCHYCLKPDGVMAINLADIKGKELEADMVRVAEQIGFKLVKKMGLALSNVNLRDKAKKFKYEPIYVFKK